MENEKVSALRSGEDIFLSYIDETGKIFSGYFIFVSLTETFLTIKSNANVLLIPVAKILKIKQRCEK